MSARYWAMIDHEAIAAGSLWPDYLRVLMRALADPGVPENPDANWYLVEDDAAPATLEGKRVKLTFVRSGNKVIVGDRTTLAMPWTNDPAKRRADAETYGSPEYRRNREAARRRAGGRCEDCGHRHDRLQCDHIIPRSQGGTHALANLAMRCVGPGSCQCHERKTAQEGGGYRKPAKDPQPRRRVIW